MTWGHRPIEIRAACRGSSETGYAIPTIGCKFAPRDGIARQMLFQKAARHAGLEPATFGFGGRRSNPTELVALRGQGDTAIAV